jgi:hypothetical protein
MSNLAMLELILDCINLQLTKAHSEGDMETVKRIYIARNAVLLSIVEEQQRLLTSVLLGA